jgi:cytochrome c oxidase assembly protein subunit 15
VILFEGIIGAQVREMTDELAKFHDNAPRSTWIEELEGSWKYLAHRSFSWVVLVAAIVAYILSSRHRVGGAGRVEKVVLGIVLAQMVLGMVMAQIHIYSWVQVLHVGLAAVLLTFVWLWWFGLLPYRQSKA